METATTMCFIPNGIEGTRLRYELPPGVCAERQLGVMPSGILPDGIGEGHIESCALHAVQTQAHSLSITCTETASSEPSVPFEADTLTLSPVWMSAMVTGLPPFIKEVLAVVPMVLPSTVRLEGVFALTFP